VADEDRTEEPVEPPCRVSDVIATEQREPETDTEVPGCGTAYEKEDKPCAIVTEQMGDVPMGQQLQILKHMTLPTW
jgi:hypothetical protein